MQGYSRWNMSNHMLSKEKVTSGVVYKIQCGFWNQSCYDEYLRHLNVRILEQIRILPLTKKKVKPEGSAIKNRLLLCNHPPYFESFCVLTMKNRAFVLELKKSLLIMEDKPSLNKSSRSTPLYLFNRV